MSRFLVTGIAGFIGSSLARELLLEGHEVVGVDNLSTGSLGNLSSVLDEFEFHWIDINETDALREACHGVDVVFHQAALASVPRSVADPVTTHVANVDGTLSVLLAARDAGVRRVVYAASSSAYGDEPTQPKHEDMLPAPLSPYATQKLTGEHYVRNFSQIYGLEGVCLRYFNVFGPRQSANSPYSGVIARFADDMLAGRTPTIFGDGLQSRDFTFVQNIVKANMLAAAAPASAVSGEVINIGTGHSHTLRELYEAMAKDLQFDREPIYAAPRAGDVPHSLASIEKARRLLDYVPEVSFEEGLRLTTEWYEESRAHRDEPSRPAPKAQEEGMSRTRHPSVIKQLWMVP